MNDKSAHIASKWRNPPQGAAMGAPQLVRLPQLKVPKVRLLPTLMVAAGALLLLKSIGIISGDGYILSAQPAFAQEAAAEAVPEAAAEGETEGEAPTEGEQTAEADPAQSQRPAEAAPIGIDTERTILERLAERRQRLNDFENQLQTRLAVVEAAEKRLDARAAELKRLEEQVNSLVAEREGSEKKRFEALVSMYETMKPKDAARIFDRIQIDVLQSLVKEMNPRKMAAILAKMSSEKAQALTLAIALGDAQQSASAAPQDISNLPQIVGN